MLRLMNIPRNHPRAESLHIREKLVDACRRGIVVPEGLMAHGRGEAFDYILGEQTAPFARRAIRAAVAAMLLAKNPVISVNGNVATLVPDKVVELADAVGASLEVNIFYRTRKREAAIAKVLRNNGADEILGVGKNASATLPELQSERRRVDPRGILTADVVLVPLEDGDRTEVLRKMSKTVVTIDLNPFSRTSLAASISVVDNITRAIPLMIEETRSMSRSKSFRAIIDNFDNGNNLNDAFAFIAERLLKFASGERNV